MRPTVIQHQLAITEALKSPTVKEQIALREAVPHMYLLNIKCDCISVQSKFFKFRITMDYTLIHNNQIPSHEDVVIFVEVKKEGSHHEVTVAPA